MHARRHVVIAEIAEIAETVGDMRARPSTIVMEGVVDAVCVLDKFGEQEMGVGPCSPGNPLVEENVEGEDIVSPGARTGRSETDGRARRARRGTPQRTGKEGGSSVGTARTPPSKRKGAPALGAPRDGQSRTIQGTRAAL